MDHQVIMRWQGNFYKAKDKIFASQMKRKKCALVELGKPSHIWAQAIFSRVFVVGTIPTTLLFNLKYEYKPF